MDREQARDYIKDQLEGYLRSKRINTARLFNCLNPDHADKNPSMSYDSKRKKAHCFSCNADYDTFDLIGIEHGLTEPGEIFNKAHQIYGINIDAHHTQQAKGPIDQTAYIELAHSRAKETDYFNKRGISPATIDRFLLGYDDKWQSPTALKRGINPPPSPRIIIPTSMSSYIARDTRTELTEQEKKYRKMKEGPSQPFNLPAIQSGKPVFIVEGELDALSLVEVGAEAVALGGIANANQLIKYLKSNPPKGGLILSLDNDQAGRDTTVKLAQELEGMGISFLQANIAGTYNDPNEALVNNREAFTQAIQDIQDAINAQEQAEHEAEREEYQKESTAHYIDAFRNGIDSSVDTPVISTGFKQLDKILDGGLYEGLYIMGAISSLGKTTFIMQIADQIAMSGNDVLIFSLEMARSQLMAKSISRLTWRGEEKVNLAKTTRGITTGKRYADYSTEEKEIIDESIKAYAEYANHIYISEGMGDIGVGQIRAGVERHTRLTGSTPVVIIDYLQLLAPYNVRATDKQNIDKAVMELKRISRDYKTPVIAVSSFNRLNYNNPVSMESFKESGAIEYSSDVLIGLQAEGAGGTNFNINDAKNKDPRKVELVLLKGRDGETGKVIKYKYYAPFNFFEESKEPITNFKGW